jgi:hypothetical protein
MGLSHHFAKQQSNGTKCRNGSKADIQGVEPMSAITPKATGIATFRLAKVPLWNRWKYNRTPNDCDQTIVICCNAICGLASGESRQGRVGILIDGSASVVGAQTPLLPKSLT